ncbi:lysine-rich arabinogalactan protein 19-like [Panicum virgatum]|uniref:lysine-rich arabinogalactan protein 19-like n=1 Tax=Panicum virgatum TaxID=38727 RepID=UPI0019D5FAF3|nr:lysine-rich arabinogalactan protein 19-like [Panicum virgatum]
MPQISVLTPDAAPRAQSPIPGAAVPEARPPPLRRPPLRAPDAAPSPSTGAPSPSPGAARPNPGAAVPEAIHAAAALALVLRPCPCRGRQLRRGRSRRRRHAAALPARIPHKRDERPPSSKPCSTCLVPAAFAISTGPSMQGSPKPRHGGHPEHCLPGTCLTKAKKLFY